MTRHQLAALLCRLLALYFLYEAVATTFWYLSLIQVQQQFADPEVREGLYMTVNVVGLLPWAAAGLLWFGAGWLARRMVADGPLPELPHHLGARTLLSIGLVLLGLYWLVAGASTLAQPELALTHPQRWPGLIQIAAGLWFVLGSRGIVNALRLLHRTAGHLRTAATQASNENP